MAMTPSRRFHAAMNREPLDRLPMLEWATWWDQTLNHWRTQGLPEPAASDLPPVAALHEMFGLDPIVQLWYGLRTAQTPEPAHHGAAIVRTMGDYLRIRPTLYPRDIDEAAIEHAARLQRDGRAIVFLTLEGAFWGPRTLLGIEGHLLAFYDEPDLMRAINEDLLAYNLDRYERFSRLCVPDFVSVAEDMSYNLGPMISESAFDEFMLPFYAALSPALKRDGARLFVDSDGDVTTAVPWFLRAGIEGILPLERQAGVDLGTLRAAHPELLCIGHFDKMTMPRGEDAMRAEFERLLPEMRRGGFAPSVDHQTPPGCSLENYRTYLRLFEEYARRAAAR